MAMKNDAAEPAGAAQSKPVAPSARLTQQVQKAWKKLGKTTQQLFAETRDCYSFSKLVESEYQRLDRATPRAKDGKPLPVSADPRVTKPGIADEPWVSFTPRDLFGLALSGGGIRSATFNLGLFQALERKQLLKDLHYVSTVSGGGYIGGFWTAWRSSNPR